ncbi:hypothetical protein AAULR_16814, partial [Lacticaseibacillus rhamnosus MTCC 5462]
MDGDWQPAVDGGFDGWRGCGAVVAVTATDTPVVSSATATASPK